MTATELGSIGPVALVAVIALGCYEVGRARTRACGIVQGVAATGPVAAPDPAAAPAPRATPFDWRAWLFRAAVVMAVAILLPPFGRWGPDELFARAVVDVTMAFAVAPLLVLGDPRRMAATFRRPEDDRDPDAVRRSATGPLVVPVRRAMVRPLAGVAAYVAVLFVWHAPAVVDASAHSVWAWDAQIGCYLVGGLLLWSQLIGRGAAARTWEPLARTWLLLAVLVFSSAVGATMLFASGSWYPAFNGGVHRLLPWSLDQAFAGAIVGVLPAIPLGALAWWCYAEWLRRDEDDDLHLNQLLASAGAAVPVAGVGVRHGHASMEDGKR